MGEAMPEQDLNQNSKTAAWYVVHTYSGYENKVKDNLEKAAENNRMQHLIQEVAVPVEEVAEIKNGKRVITQHKTFPGYVLVKMIITSESWFSSRGKGPLVRSRTVCGPTASTAATGRVA